VHGRTRKVGIDLNWIGFGSSEDRRKLLYLSRKGAEFPGIGSVGSWIDSCLQYWRYEVGICIGFSLIELAKMKCECENELEIQIPSHFISILPSGYRSTLLP